MARDGPPRSSFFPSQFPGNGHRVAAKSTIALSETQTGCDLPKTKETNMSNKRPQGRIGERSAVTGRFVRDGTAKRRPSTTVREHIPLPGKGTAKAKYRVAVRLRI